MACQRQIRPAGTDLTKKQYQFLKADSKDACEDDLVGLAQLAEHRIVVPGVVGSSPISHPTEND